MPGPYRPPNEEEENYLRVLNGDESIDGPQENLGEEEANTLLDWLKMPEHQNVSVNAWWWNSNDDWLGKEGPTTILSIVYESDEIPVDHPIIAELDNRDPEFESRDVIKNLVTKIAFFKRNKMMEEERAKNIVTKLAHAKEIIERKAAEEAAEKERLQQVLAVLPVLNEIAEKINLPEDIQAKIAAYLTGKTGPVAGQEAELRKNNGGRRKRKTVRRAKQSKSRKRGAQR